MSEVIQKFILSVFGDNPIIATIFISMIPVVELRGAIPFGSSKEIWGEKALSLIEAGIYSVIGSIISAILIVLLIIPVFNLLKKTKVFNILVQTFEEKFLKKSNQIIIKSKHKQLKKWLGIMLFVAIPLPLTGVWTGSAVAVFLKMGFYKSVTAVSVGAVISCIIVMLISSLLQEKALMIFYFFIIILAILIVLYLIKIIIKDKRVEKNDL